jgi:hypothetical protein
LEYHSATIKHNGSPADIRLNVQGFLMIPQEDGQFPKGRILKHF